MIRYLNPTAVRHQGRGVLIAERIEIDPNSGVETHHLVYNILALNPDITDDGLGWQGFTPLPDEALRQTSMAGFSVLRVLGVDEFNGPAQAVSDEKHVYLFRPDQHALSVERFLLVETADANARDGRGFALIPDWEVRFRRSGSADLPASADDVSTFRDPDGEPFLDPRRYLSLAPGGEDLDLARGFAALLLPNGEDGRLLWRLFARTIDGSQLFGYAIPRLDDGWFDLGAVQRDDSGRLLPVSRISLALEAEQEPVPMQFTGALAATLYQRLEAMVSAEGEAVQMRTANRVFLAAPARRSDVSATTDDARLLTLDFEVELDGELAYDGTPSPRILVGSTGPDPLSLDFALPSSARVERPLPAPPRFTLQAWMCPLRGPVDAEQAGSPRLLLSQSGDAPLTQRGPTLEIVNQFRIRVGFGNGETTCSGLTGNVLTYGSWSNISASFDGERLRVYMNGAEVPVVQSGDPGTGPVGQIDLIGADRGGFVGRLTETRVWSRALSGDEVRASLFEPLPDPEGTPDLVAYWPMDGGVGTGIADRSGNGHDARMVGAVWADGTAPLARPGQPINQIDAQNRGLSAGWLTPSSTYPKFGPVVADARPFALATGDGPIHLYYPASPTRMLTAARMSGTAARAFFLGAWSAADGDATVETGALVFISRQTGAYNSFTSIALDPGDDQRVTNAHFDGAGDGSGYSRATIAGFARFDGDANAETWKGVPRRLGLFEQIIAGRAASDPTDPRIGEGRAAYYDYAGLRKQVYVGLGHPSALAALRIVGTQTSDFDLQRFTGRTSAGRMTVSVSTGTRLGEPLVVQFGPVAASVDSVIALLQGRAEDSAYLDGADSSPVWALPAATRSLFLIAPRRNGEGFAVASAVFDLSAGAALELADFTAELTLGDQTTIRASWKDAPREASAFIAFLHVNPSPEQAAVLNQLAFLDRTEGTPLSADAVKVTERSSLRYATSLIAAFREGSGGTLPDVVDQQAAVLQGVAGLQLGPFASAPSAIISAQAAAQPTSGYPAAVEFGRTPVGIALASAGRDGGWLADPPRYAQGFNGEGALAVDLANLVPSPDVYEVPAPLAVECWINPDPSRRAADQNLDTLQSILHFSAAETGMAYTVGMKPSETPRFFERVEFFLDEPLAAAPEDRLVRDRQYTVQIYLRPSLIAAGTAPFWTRTSPAFDKFEMLSIRVQPASSGGQPQRWKLLFTSQQIEMEASQELAGDQWSLVTLVRDGARASLYINGELALARDDVPAVDLDLNRYIVSNPKGNAFFEFDPNEFAAWNRPRTPQEIRTSYLTPLTGAEPAMVVLYPLSQKESNYRLVNLCRWTTTLYDSSLYARPFFTNTGLFFDLVGAFGEHAATTSTPVLAPGRWRHAAVVLNRRGALRLSPGQSAAASGTRETLPGASFAVDARVLMERRENSRQVVVSRFGNRPQEQLYELGVREDGRAYATVRLQSVAPEGLGSDQGLITLLGPAERPVLPGSAHHLAVSMALQTLSDKRTGREVTALRGTVYVDGVGGEPPIEAPTDIAVQRLVTVIGGRGSGFYRAGETVSIEAHDRTHFRGWSATVVVADPASYKTTIVMGTGDAFADVVVAANAFIDPVEFNRAGSPTRVGRAGGEGDGPFIGQVSDVRVWGEALDSAEVNELSAMPGASPFDGKLVSWWPFSEQVGRLAKDAVGDNDLTLSSSVLWAWFDAASASFVVDGQPVPARGMSHPPVSATPRQMRIGGLVENSAGRFGAGMRGQLDELRLWRGPRTREQILDNRARYLTGAESGLIGYWRFDTGSGDIVADRTIHRGDARYYDNAGKPASIPWTHSSAPVGFDAAIVDDALDTRGSAQAVQLADAPAAIAVFEYADSVPLPDGGRQGVLKRSYVYEGLSGMADDTGYKVGDLERVYIGQVQTDPTVLGFIEGAPPLPSENLTRPLTSPSDIDTYDGIASVTLTDRLAQAANFSGSQESSSKLQMKFSVGGAGAAEKDEVIGLPPIQSAIKSVTFQLKLGAVVTAAFESKEGSEAGLAATTERGLTQTLANGGQWERKNPDGGYFLESGERRYIPGNIGSALVKSRVADLYALRIPSSGALVSLTAEPNPDIPVDINILRFPIDPLYQLAGSLDGRIGLQKAPMTGSSYYKPREAYTLKRDVERQRQALAAYFAQTDLQAQLGNGSELGRIRAANPLFSGDLEVPVRDMVNTYVWSAGGGSYAESEGFSTELTESYSLGRSFEFGVGFNLSIFFTIFGVGITVEGEVTNTLARSFNATKTLSRSRALQLDVEAAPDPFPFKFEADHECGEEPVPGKVDAYRFMTFFLANRASNADALFNTVIDQRWLRTSQDPNASALRQAEAMSAGTSPWRILHRVTYVSRIPPKFQAVPPLTDRGALPEAPNQNQNAVFLSLVRAKLPPGGASAAEISQAVQVVMERDLLALMPWWADYLEAARVDNSSQQSTYRKVLRDAIDYAISVIGVDV